MRAPLFTFLASLKNFTSPHQKLSDIFFLEKIHYIFPQPRCRFVGFENRKPTISVSVCSLVRLAAFFNITHMGGERNFLESGNSSPPKNQISTKFNIYAEIFDFQVNIRASQSDIKHIERCLKKCNDRFLSAFIAQKTEQNCPKFSPLFYWIFL